MKVGHDAYPLAPVLFCLLVCLSVVCPFLFYLHSNRVMPKYYFALREFHFPLLYSFLSHCSHICLSLSPFPNPSGAPPKHPLTRAVSMLLADHRSRTGGTLLSSRWFSRLVEAHQLKAEAPFATVAEVGESLPNNHNQPLVIQANPNAEQIPHLPASPPLSLHPAQAPLSSKQNPPDPTAPMRTRNLFGLDSSRCTTAEHFPRDQGPFPVSSFFSSPHLPSPSIT